MRFSSVAVTVLGVAASASASNLSARQSTLYPNCAIPCFENANPGSCSLTNYLCLCNNQAFVSSTTQCIKSSCTGADLQSALSTAQQVCTAVGVTLSSVPAATGSSAPAAASPSASAKSGASKTGRNALLGLSAAALAAFCL